MKKISICHFSSVHPADDVRIFHKECKSLATRADWDVHFVGNGPLDTDSSEVTFHPLPVSRSKNRAWRMMVRGWIAYRLARSVNADIYHFHDPELLPWGLLLKWHRKLVIYDAHEDVPRDILTKAWIPAPLRRFVAGVAEWIENFIARRLDWVITATPFIRDRFLAEGVKALDINNFPKLHELGQSDSRPLNRSCVCYTGAIMEERGARQMIEALGEIGVSLNLAGSCSPPSLRKELVTLPAWEQVIELGQIKRHQLRDVFSSSFAGLVLFHPVPNNVNAQPNKLFEYMSAGLPVIASHFPLWRQIIEQVGCGICVDPLNVTAIKSAICWLRDNPEAAAEMGRRGAEAVLQRFNWDAESFRLLDLYEKLLEKNT